MLSRTLSVRIVALWLGLAALAAWSPAWAQSQWIIGISGGMTKPTGGWFSSEWNKGPTILLTVAQQTSAKVELGGEFGFTKFEPSGDSVHVPGITPGDIRWEQWRLRFRARRFFAGPDSKVAPFAMVGAGVYPLTILTEDSTGVYKITPTSRGVSIGGGVDYRAGEAVHFGIEAQYHYVWVDQAIVGYKAAPFTDVLFAIRWLPGGPE
jgi:outer membrane protein with beta-barrel domain